MIRRQWFGFGAAVGLIAACIAPMQLYGQQTAASSSDVEAKRRGVREMADSLRRSERPAVTVPSKGWKRARTTWGDPDIEGVYTNADEWGTPFERPIQFEGRGLESVTPQELAKLRETNRDAYLERLATGVPAEPGTIGWYDTLNAKNSRAWLILDPPDGHLPSLTPVGQRRAEAEAQLGPRAANSYTDLGAYARCISRGLPGSMFPETYGNAYEIHQGPGYVAIRYEQIHETRVIPMDGRHHVGRAIQTYMGDARGQWAGDALTIETTNFKQRLNYFPSALRAAFRGVDSAALRLIERFTPLAPELMEWSVTVDEPTTWVRPWTFAMNLTEVDRSQQPYEYACHEGNYGLRNILETARTLEGR